MPPPRLTIPDVLDRFAAYLADHPTWGVLHVILDDGNTEDGMVRSCLDHPSDPTDTEGIALLAILLQLTRTQRGKLGHRGSARLRELQALN